MKNIFKNYFIPYKTNNYQPHLLQPGSVKFIVGFVIILELVFLAHIYLVFPKTFNLLGLVLSDVVVSETNINRVSDDLEPLSISLTLQEAAREKAEDMAKNGYFSHTSPDGKTPWYWFERVGYDFVYAGENLAVNFIDSKDVVDAWMNSSSHRLNILNSYFTEIGIGVAQGMYNGQEATFVVQLFGKPIPKSLATSEIKTDLNQVAVVSTPTLIPTPIPTLEVVPVNNDGNFVAVKGTEVINNQIAETTKANPTSEDKTIASEPLVLEEIISQPNSSLNYIYFIMGMIILIVVFLSIFIKTKVQYPRLLLNGFLMLALIGGLVLANYLLVFNSVKII